MDLELNRYRARLLTSAATTLALLVSPATTVAQDTDEENLEEITVTGIRASIRNSVAKKRNSSSIVEAISAEDIGKLPDASIGESLARLPGLAAQRFDGRANKISIRGLAPDFTTTTLNGRELVSSDNNRGVEYDQFPSELITGATVYKTPDATLTSQAIGGTVDMQTVRPLAYDEPQFVVGLRGELSDKGALNSGTSSKGYRGNIAYIGQNEDGTVGYALGYSRMVQPIQEQYIHYWGYSEQTDADGDSGLFLDGAKPYVKSNELTRDGLLGVVEVKATDDVRFRLDVMYSKFDDEQTLRGQEIAGYTKDSIDIISVEDGVVTEGIMQGLHTMARNDFSDRKVETFAAGFNVEYDASDDLSFELDVSYSEAKRNFAAYETYASNGRGQSGPGSDVGYAMTGENGAVFSSNLDFADPNVWGLGDNLGWGGPLCTEALGWQCDSQDGFRNQETSKDDMAAIKLAAVQQLDGPINSIEYGIRYSDRSKEHTRDGFFLTLNDYPNVVSVPSEYLLEPTSLGFMGLGDSFSYDARALVDSGVYFFSPENEINALTNDWSVNEKVFNAYVMANVDATLGDTPVTGNVGLHVVHTDQSSTGTQVEPTGPNLITEGDKYWKVLPSMNLSFEVSEAGKVRLGVARVMARARMDQMNATRSINYFGGNADNNTGDLRNSPWSGGGGNPYLRPWMSWQFDLGYEHYFDEGGYVALAGFYKKLDNFHYNQSTEYDFSPFLDQIDTTLDGAPWTNLGLISQPENGGSGKIYGLEASLSLPFSTFSENLKDFGFIGSASLTKSNVKETPDSVETRLPGLSEKVVNGTVYYENDTGFSARLSARYRSSFLAEAFAIGLSREEIEAVGEMIVDAQVSYDLSTQGFEGVTLYLQGSNLTNEPFKQIINGNDNLPKNFHTYGRNFMLGFTYKM
ncbi:TonB-dependent receptor [Temperatibacter marinus]|uniref:TonB-dependent receptor n=1 Tax=Temperatibacter marinus TaxID=1456591 RepID=A0AA52EIV8_9PROT|nr:TonB-dependent receptor [Temperatibacter marinus]WND03104.1 TonB-dependent receptor [Temperatibacter marinus]